MTEKSDIQQSHAEEPNEVLSAAAAHGVARIQDFENYVGNVNNLLQLAIKCFT